MNLTAVEIQNIRNEYANEDFAILMESGYMAITNTKHGLICLEVENGEFKADNGAGQVLMTTSNEQVIKDFIASSYVFAEA